MNFWNSAFAVRRISDSLCIENGLSIVENPGGKSKHYGEWLGDDKPVTWSEKLRQAIDAVLEKKPADLSVFIQLLKESGYEVKQGKYISCRAISAPGDPVQKKFIRLKSLGANYTDGAIFERILGKRIIEPEVKTAQKKPMYSEPDMNLLIDIQNNIKAKNSPAYEQWARIFNIKETSKTLIFLQENNLTEYKKLEEKTAESVKIFDGLSTHIKQKQTRLDEIAALQKTIANYSRTRDIYIEYRKSGYSKNFYTEHMQEIETHKAAKKVFDSFNGQKIPTIKELKIEYATVLGEKGKLYSEYKKAKETMRELVTAKRNVQQILHISPSKNTRTQENLSQ